MNPYLNSILDFESEVVDVSLLGETLAYTWFGRPNYAYSAEAQKYWIGSTKDTPSGTTQHVTEFDIIENSYTTTQVGTAFQKDDHNQAQILIRESDKRLIAFYTEHSGPYIRYRISTNPLDSTNWGDEQLLNPSSSYSYVSPYEASNGNIFIFFRSRPSSTSIWYYMKSTDGGETFGSAVEFYNNGAVQAYLISFQEGDKLHFAADNGHPDTNINLNINTYHLYFDLINETTHLSNGTQISIPFDASDISLVNLSENNDTSWILDISVKNNLPRILFCFYPEGRANQHQFKELWLALYDGENWIIQKISENMEGYIEDDNSITQSAYPPASRFDTKNPDLIWMPKQINGVLEIHKVDIKATPPYIEQITFDSEVDNWRPISVPSPENNLLWIKKNSYEDYVDYDLSLQTKTVQV